MSHCVRFACLSVNVLILRLIGDIALQPDDGETSVQAQSGQEALEDPSLLRPAFTYCTLPPTALIFPPYYTSSMALSCKIALKLCT